MYSVIIPVYNAAPYLNTCVQSITNQKIETPVEIILINDGSTDGSGVLCDELASKDTRIRTFHQKNSGVSSARNLGIQQAKGEYLLFVDSDDTLSENALSVLEQQLRTQPSDVVVYEIEFMTNGTTTYTTQLDNCHAKTIDEVRCLAAEIYKKGSIATCCNKLYSRSLIGNNTFCEDLQYGEDLCFNLKVFEKAQSITTIDVALYQYNQHSNSLSTNVDKRQVTETLLLYEASETFFDTLQIDVSEKNRLLSAHYFEYLYPYQISKIAVSKLLTHRQKLESIRQICQTEYGSYCIKKANTGLFQKLVKWKAYRGILLYTRLLSILKKR